MRYLLFCLLFFSYGVHAQTLNKTDSNRVTPADTLVIDSGFKDSLKIFKPTIYDYTYQTQFSEKKIFDTVFTKDKTFIFSQYNNRDNFGRIQFANIGSGFQQLVYEVNPEQNLSLLPTNKSYFIKGINDIRYYDVKTPTTAFIYHNAVRNGAQLQSTYTQNIGKNFNFAVEYIGLRSQGLYRNSLAANNSTEFSGHYFSKNKKYEAFAHFIHQNVNNEENGGIADLDLFLNGNSDFNNRENLEVNLLNSTSRFSYRRYYFSHEFRPFASEKFPFKIRHTVFHQGNKYYFSQSSPENFYFTDESELLDYPTNSKKYSKNLSNTVSILFDKENFKLDAGLRYQMIKLGIGDKLPQNLNIPSELSENRLGAVGNLKINLWDKVALNSNLEFSSGNQFGPFLRSQNLLRFEPFPDYFVNAKVNFQTASPSFNLLINPSVYRKFNYYLENPKNETITEIGGDVNLKWFQSKVFGNFFRIDNYTFLNSEAQPQQNSSSLNISQLGGEATFSYGKFHLNPKVLFQSALGNKDVLPMPNVVARANLFWQSKAFKNAAEIQTGIKVYYFSKFNSREFFPVVNEFILPDANTYAIGGQPIADVYFNLKVKRMFFFLEAQHVNTTIMQNKSFTAPYYPLYDFRLNIGIVWYLFS
ncbi:Putative porin [Kaistella treverensis]|uniref:Putative porin n=1 Tax=Kaistella treverensis TaxID=631455 RepID=A0A1I3MAH0_9FLAO|nr:putative porin [Kaistella treverensis]SFI93981.1 Putative porin [Kaistella treverensis]